MAARYKNRLEENNGINEQNLRTILGPAGVELDSIDRDWLAIVDAFSVDRGKIAHMSNVQHQVDPASELDRVTRIVDGLRLIDQQLRMSRR